MFDELTEALDRIEVPGFVDAADLLAGLSLFDRFEALLREMLASFDATEGWDLDPYAATSCRTFLTGAGDRTEPDAQRWLRDARWCATQPVVSAAARSGDLSRGQVDAIRANVTRDLAPLFAEHAPLVVPELIGLSVADTAEAMRDWRARAEATVETPEPVERAESLFVSRLLDGRRRVDGNLDALHGKTLEKALELADSNDFAVSPAERRAQALADVARFFLDHREVSSGRRNRPHLHLVLDAETGTATHLDGEPVSRPELERLLCDATIQRVVTARSVTIDLGHDEYAVSKHVWDTIAVRDQRCRFDDHCRAAPSRCDAHHVIAYPIGSTNQHNLVLLCDKHHRRLHKPGWLAYLGAGGAFHVTDPSGRSWSTYPAGPTPEAQARAKRERRARTRAERERARRRRRSRPGDADALVLQFSDSS